MNRKEAYSRGLVFRTHDMVAWLAEQTKFPEEMIYAVLGEWVGALRSRALDMIARNMDLLEQFNSGCGTLDLTKMLAPQGWKAAELLHYLSIATGVSREEGQIIFQKLRQKLEELRGVEAFEPVGWIYAGANGVFHVEVWDDFLQPICDGPIEVITGQSDL